MQHAGNELTRNSPLLRGEHKAARAAQAGAEDACQFESGRDAPSACKFFILDASEIAAELGLPTCNEVPCCELVPSSEANAAAHAEVESCSAV